jgi:hypothetical protein
MNGKALSWFAVCFCGSLLFVVGALHCWGAAEIRADFGEVIFLTLACGVWLALATKLFAWFGLSLRDDAMERRNDASLAALCGALVSAAMLYAGGSVGEGPSYMNNVFSVGLAALGFFSLWMTLEIGTSVSMAIAEERDVASGIRLAAFLLSIALVLGRAVAGDWHSASATVRDFFNDGWFAVLICALAVPLEHFARPNRTHPFRAWAVYGLLPGLFYLALAAGWVWHLGVWEGMTR